MVLGSMVRGLENGPGLGEPGTGKGSGLAEVCEVEMVFGVFSGKKSHSPPVYGHREE